MVLLFPVPVPSHSLVRIPYVNLIGANQMIQQWQSLANGKILDFETMAIDLRRCAGVPIGQAKQALIESNIGDVYLDCVRIL